MIFHAKISENVTVMFDTQRYLCNRFKYGGGKRMLIKIENMPSVLGTICSFLTLLTEKKTVESMSDIQRY